MKMNKKGNDLKDHSEGVKLIIIDLYGVMSFGSYQDTCRWLCKKYNFNYEECYKIVYYKYFNRAVSRQISEAQAFNSTARELGIQESGQELRAKHLSFQHLNRSVFNLAKRLKLRGYKILLLSKNTPRQFNEVAGSFGLKKYFTVINTYNLKIPKHSPRMIRYILMKYKLNPEEIIMTDDQEFNLVYPQKIGVRTILYRDFKDFNQRIKNILNN